MSVAINKENEGESELSIYALDVIAGSTNNFSHSNKLGEGGFGAVYKVFFLFIYIYIFI